jgi:MFS-type transporter involved in bile tolerance (Atg22 family)
MWGFFSCGCTPSPRLLLPYQSGGSRHSTMVFMLGVWLGVVVTPMSAVARTPHVVSAYARVLLTGTRA